MAAEAAAFFFAEGGSCQCSGRGRGDPWKRGVTWNHSLGLKIVYKRVEVRAAE